MFSREFAARLSLVWNAFTKTKIVDQWATPEPWTMRTISKDFKVGGRRSYKMASPDGQEHFFSSGLYSDISGDKFKIHFCFSDKDENINPEFYGSENNLDLSEANRITAVRITIKYKTPASLEMMIEKGFREGITMTLDNLEKLLVTLHV